MLQGPKDLLEKNGAVLKLDQMKIPIVGKYTKDQKQQNLSKLTTWVRFVLVTVLD